MSIIQKMDSIPKLVVQLLYGDGLRITECLCLRIKDLDFDNHQIIVQDGKGEKDRTPVLPDSLFPGLKSQVASARLIHQKDLNKGFSEVSLPYALAGKYSNAAREFAWQCLSIRKSIHRSGLETHQTASSGCFSSAKDRQEGCAFCERK